MSLERQKHWGTRSYHQFLEQHAFTPFKWGEHDCALFAANGIQAMTGVDIDDDFRGKYTDEASALALISQVTGKANATLVDGVEWATAKHGLVEWKYPLMAQRGDLVLLEDSGRIITGLIHLSGRHIVAAGEEGLKRILIHDGTTSPILRAWKV